MRNVRNERYVYVFCNRFTGFATGSYNSLWMRKCSKMTYKPLNILNVKLGSDIPSVFFIR